MEKKLTAAKNIHGLDVDLGLTDCVVTVETVHSSKTLVKT